MLKSKSKFEGSNVDNQVIGKIKPAFDIMHDSDEDFDNLPNWVRDI